MMSMFLCLMLYCPDTFRAFYGHICQNIKKSRSAEKQPLVYPVYAPYMSALCGMDSAGFPFPKTKDVSMRFPAQIRLSVEIGVTRFELATPWSQTRCSSQTEPHPVRFYSDLCILLISAAFVNSFSLKKHLLLLFSVSGMRLRKSVRDAEMHCGNHPLSADPSGFRLPFLRFLLHFPLLC